jgi:acetylornithine deacetylase/succinyl-diaminopimelate desuccinylase-like protein
VYVVGEETDAVGALKLLELPITPYLLNGEPTGNKFARRSWGVQEFEVVAQGTSAHSSLGTADSAIHKLVTDLSRLLENQPDEVSLNIGFIRGGVATNVQAPQASCDICARIYGSSEPLAQLLAERLKLTEWRAKFPATEGLELFVPPAMRDSSIEVKFASDCSIYAKKYDNVMLFGPGVIQDAHTDDESISRAALREASEVISRLLLDIGGVG